jgi:hypothetical protein
MTLWVVTRNWVKQQTAYSNDEINSRKIDIPALTATQSR